MGPQALKSETSDFSQQLQKKQVLMHLIHVVRIFKSKGTSLSLKEVELAFQTIVTQSSRCRLTFHWQVDQCTIVHVHYNYYMHFQTVGFMPWQSHCITMGKILEKHIKNCMSQQLHKEYFERIQYAYKQQYCRFIWCANMLGICLQKLPVPGSEQFSLSYVYFEERITVCQFQKTGQRKYAS